MKLKAMITVALLAINGLWAGISTSGPVDNWTYQRLQEIWSKYPTSNCDLIILNSNEGIARAFGPIKLQNGTTMRPHVEVSTGFVRMTSPDELPFVLAHETSHILLNHAVKQDRRLDQLMSTPFTLIGATVMPWYTKMEERQADLLGQKLYLKAGYSKNLFLREAPHRASLGSLNPNDEHFSFKDRWATLKKALNNQNNQ